MGKTLDSAKLLSEQCKVHEDAGAFAKEIEVVPQQITEAIAKRTSLFLISMCGGAKGHAQYLFTDDVLGQTAGKVPRHAKVYADFHAEQERLQTMRIEAMRAFADDVHGGAYPSDSCVVDAETEVVAKFRNWLGSNA